jgi:FtsH-binding integral membrane protein
MTSGDDKKSPRLDLSDRYQHIIDIQTKSIQNFDDKTWRTMRITGIIGGVGIGTLSLINNGNGSLPESIGVQIALSVGIISFLTAFGLGIRSYQSDRFATAPKTAIGKELKDKEADQDEYESTLVENYQSAIEYNKKILKNKKSRFRQTLATVFVGICSLSLGFILAVWDPQKCASLSVLFLGLLLSIALAIATLYYGNGAEDDENDTDQA